MRGEEYETSLEQPEGEQIMKKSLMVAGVAALVIAAGAVGIAQGQGESATKNEVVYLSAAQATFKDAGPGASMAVAWGDPDKGAHGTVTELAPGYDEGRHTLMSELGRAGMKGAE